MYWSLVITSVAAAALAIGYWMHGRDRRNLEQVFGLVAARHHGDMEPGDWLALPRLRLTFAGRQCVVGAMATDGAHGGPFTFLELKLPQDTGRTMQIKRPWRAGSSGRQTSDAIELSVRALLRQSTLPLGNFRLAGRKITLHTDGFIDSPAGIEQLIDIANRIADCLEAGRA